MSPGEAVAAATPLCHPRRMGVQDASAHPLLAARASPSAFDPSHEVSEAEVSVLLSLYQFGRRLTPQYNRRQFEEGT